MFINLKDIDRKNWEECIELKVNDSQEKFVDSNVYSLLESKFESFHFPLAIYNNEVMVGFVMYSLYDESWWITRLMVDKNHQKNGYGKAAILRVVEILRNKPGCNSIFTSYEPENFIAEKLYLSLGFEKTGRIEEGEMILCLTLKN